MKFASAFIGLTVFASVGSGAARAAVWPSVEGWDVHEIDAGRCVVGRSFAGAGATFGVIMSLDGELRVFATGVGWPIRAGFPATGQVLLDGRPTLAGRGVGIEQLQNRGFVAAATPDFLFQFAGARQISIQAGPGAATGTLPLIGNAAGIAQGRRCLDSLRQTARLRVAAPTGSAPSYATPPRSGQAYTSPTRAGSGGTVPFGTAVSPSSAGAAPRTPSFGSPGMALPARTASVTPPSPRGSRGVWMADVEYPSAALSAEEQGSVTVKLAIDDSGRVAGCDVVRSSGSRVLDGETCRVLQRRARYAPATDSTGRPVAGVDQHTVRWALPD